MTVYTISGNTHEYAQCRGVVHNGVLTIMFDNTNGYRSGETVAQFPLTSVERWVP